MSENNPRPYDLNDPSELTRLYLELRGYLKVSLQDGTDFLGRKYAFKALEELCATAQMDTFPGEGGERFIIDQPATVDELASLLLNSERLFDGPYTPESLREAASIHTWVILNLSLSVHNLLEKANRMEATPIPGKEASGE